ncbi:MAG: tetratricopeptide repeat protein [Ardenticatenaceae bacterium]|nr:tetratricopeptide repeat protein [Ardenticatenaceae bacterium]
MTDLRICLLGPAEISRGKATVSQCLSQKAVGLLAYLALGPARGYTRERLAGVFWGETDDEHASFNLRRCLWTLRKAINPPGAPADIYIRHVDGRYSLDRSIDQWLDVTTFEQAVNTSYRRWMTTDRSFSSDSKLLSRPGLTDLRDAVELYGGDFLEGCCPRGCPDFMDWLFLERDRLKQQYIKGLRVLAVESAIQGRFQQAIADFQRILGVDPLNEAAHCDLMVAYYVLGQRDRAVEQYHSLCRVLRQMLDLEPLTETQALYLAIRDGAFTVQGPSYWLISAQETAAQVMPRGPFIGREPEQIKLSGALESATRGRGGLVVVSGEGGVGKTRLIEEFFYHVSGSALLILRACCYAQEQGSSYQPIIDALRAFLSTADFNYIRRLNDLWLAEVARLLPELHNHLDCLPASPALLADHERNRLYEGLVQLIAHLSQRLPLVLFLDDFHTADEPTFDLVHYLARRLESARVLIVLAIQQEALPDRPSLASLLHRLDHGGRLVTIPLTRLSEMEALELTRRTLGRAVQSEELGHHLYLETGGNPFFLVEMLKDCEERQGVSSGKSWVPSSARDVINRRLNRLDDEDIRVLTMAAVIGRQFNLATLQQVYGGDELDLLIVLDRLLSRGWIVEMPGVNPGTYEFSHGLVREAVYQTLRADWRLYLHRRVGLALESNAKAVSELASVLAHHFYNANDARKALDYSLHAATHARKLYGKREAIGHYRRALEIADQTDAVLSTNEWLEIQYQLGQAHEFLGEYDAAIAVYEAALPACDLSKSNYRRICLQLATAYDRKGEYDQALVHLRAMGAHLSEQEDPEGRLEAAMVARGMAMVHLHREQSHHALALCRQALALVEDSDGDDVKMSSVPEVVAEKVAVYEIMADSYFHLGDYHAAVGHYEQALEIARQHDWRPIISRLLLGLGKVSRRWGNYDRAGAYAQQSLNLCHQIGHIAGQAASLGALGDVAYNRGELEQAISYYGQALSTFRQIGDRHGIADYCLSLAFVKIDQEKIEEAEAHLQEAMTIGASLNAALVLIRAQYHSARVARAKGHLDEAQAGAEQVIKAAQRAGIRLLEAMGYHLWGEVLAQQRLPIQAEVRMVEGLRLLERLGDPFETAWALRSYARLLAEQGDLSHARAQLERATAVFAELGAQRELTRTNAELARLWPSQK